MYNKNIEKFIWHTWTTFININLIKFVIGVRQDQRYMILYLLSFADKFFSNKPLDPLIFSSF
jgi:hypothetical protein